MTEDTKNSSLTDPLSDVTRKERRMLLGLSMLGIFFVHAGALPTKFSALGIDLETSDQNAFLYLMAAGLIYFTVAFTIYAMSDFIVWRKIVEKEYIASYKEYMRDRDYYPQDPEGAELDSEVQNAYKKNEIWYKLTKPMSVTRVLFEFVVPLIVGLYSISTMVIHAYTNT